MIKENINADVILLSYKNVQYFPCLCAIHILAAQDFCYFSSILVLIAQRVTVSFDQLCSSVKMSEILCFSVDLLYD